MAHFKTYFSKQPGQPYTFTESETETVIPGVSVITEGPAESHFVEVPQTDGTTKDFQVYIDEKTLEQVEGAARKYENGVKVKANHKSGVQDVIGRLTNFVRGTTPEGKPNTRADLHLFKTSPLYTHTLTLLKTIADTIGFSAVIDGPMERKGDGFFLRCEELFSVDLVSEPSANPNGTFDRVLLHVDSPQQDQGAGTMPTKKTPEQFEADMESALSTISSRMAAYESTTADLKRLMEAMQPKKGGDAPANPSDKDGDEALYSRLEKKVKETITAELQNTAKTLTALGLTPGSGPAPSIEKTTNAPGSQKKPEEMNFLELLEVEFGKAENAGKPDHVIVQELARAHPAKHRAQRDQRDSSGRFSGFERLPRRAVPFKAKA